MQYRHIEQAQRLLSKEQGAVLKDWGGRAPLALIYANTYKTGMGSLGIQQVYSLFNRAPGVVCERAFWGGTPLSLESQRPLADFPMLAFSLSYELDYLNAAMLLRSEGIPLLAAERDDDEPLLLAGGAAVTANPEPLVDIFDAFAIGEAEEIVPALAEALPELIRMPRAEALAALAGMPGLYVPSLNRGPVTRLWSRDLAVIPAVTRIYSPGAEFGDRTLIEIARGCGRGCRYCLAGFTYRPMRELPLETLLPLAREGLRQRRKVGLVSAAVSDHSQIDEIARELRGMGAQLSVASLRLDSLSETLVQALAESGTQTLTLAPEAGSERLRAVINKPQTVEQLLRAAELAAKYRFPELKLYFMVGQPTETMADVEAIAELTELVKGVFPRKIVINATPYVPKAQTPFEREAMLSAAELVQRIRLLESRLKPQGIMVKSDSPAWAQVEGILARGDRRLGKVLARLEGVTMPAWNKAMQEEGLTAEEYLSARPPDAPLAWRTVDMGVRPEYLAWDATRSSRGESTAACPPDGCMRCGVCDQEWAFGAR
jgi:radical SAM superfamily enzyme YgiQ (UPF0313 family)